MTRALGLTALFLSAACASGQSQVPPATPDSQAANDLVPVGYGRLNQDDLSIRLGAGDLEIRFVPLEERTLRLLAPDAYRALHDLRESRRAGIDSTARRFGAAAPGTALITFFAARAGQNFQPQDVAITFQNQEFRAIGIIPISANFSGQQLGARGQASALYVFEIPVPVLQEFTLSYQAARTDTWRSRITAIQREQDRVMMRVRADTAQRP